MTLARYIFVCWKAWRTLRAESIAYVTFEQHGVPAIALCVARDREAWRVVHYAIESSFARPKR
jgi:hypothetical protein